MCRVTGSRHFSRDLPQGSVEIPCMFVFQGNSKYLDKARKLLLTTESPTNDRSRVQASDISKSADSVDPTATTAKVPTNDKVQVSDNNESAGRVEPITTEVPTRVQASKNAITVKPTITANAKAVEVKSVIELDSYN